MRNIPTLLDRPDKVGRHQLKELSPKHKQVMALLAQGLDRGDIAKICDLAPEYVTWLAGDPLCKAYLREMMGYVETRMEALFDKSVDVIAESMLTGGEDAKLKAARMQLEATGRIGRTDRAPREPGAPDRLEQLAERLVALMKGKREGVTYDAEVQHVERVLPSPGEGRELP